MILHKRLMVCASALGVMAAHDAGLRRALGARLCGRPV